MPVVWVAASRGIRRLGRSFGTSIETRLNSRVTLPAGLRRGSQFLNVKSYDEDRNLLMNHVRHRLPRAGVPRLRTNSNKQGITMRKPSCLLALVGASCLWSA